MFGELSMNHNYVRSSAQARQYIPLALSHTCQARHEFSSLALCPAKALPVPILGPAPGRWTQFDITVIDPANICFYLPALTHTAFVDWWNNSRTDRQADAQNVRCRGIADVGRMVANPAFFIPSRSTPRISRFFVKNKKHVKSVCLQH